MARISTEQKIQEAISANNEILFGKIAEMLNAGKAQAQPQEQAQAQPQEQAQAQPQEQVQAQLTCTEGEKNAFQELVNSNGNLRLKSREFLRAIGWLFDNGNQEEEKAEIRFSELKSADCIGRFGAAYYGDKWEWKGKGDNRKPKGPRSQKDDKHGGEIPEKELDALIRADDLARKFKQLYGRRDQSNNGEQEKKPDKLEIAQKAVVFAVKDISGALTELLNASAKEQREKALKVLLVMINSYIDFPDSFVSVDWLKLNFSVYRQDNFNEKNAINRQDERRNEAYKSSIEKMKK